MKLSDYTMLPVEVWEMVAVDEKTYAITMDLNNPENNCYYCIGTGGRIVPDDLAILTDFDKYILIKARKPNEWIHDRYLNDGEIGIIKAKLLKAAEEYNKTHV